jgi:hypothetical protein
MGSAALHRRHDTWCAPTLVQPTEAAQRTPAGLQ